MFPYILLALTLAALAWCLIRQGRAGEKTDDMQQVLDDIQKANSARDALEHSPDAARRVRERFTR